MLFTTLLWVAILITKVDIHYTYSINYSFTYVILFYRN